MTHQRLYRACLYDSEHELAMEVRFWSWDAMSAMVRARRVFAPMTVLDVCAASDPYPSHAIVGVPSSRPPLREARRRAG